MRKKYAEMGSLLLWNTEIEAFCNVEIAIGFLRKRLIVPKDGWSECGKNEKKKENMGVANDFYNNEHEFLESHE